MRLLFAVEAEPISTEPVVPRGVESSHGPSETESQWSQYLTTTYDKTVAFGPAIVQNSSMFSSMTPFLAQKDDLRAEKGTR
jgi:hypothetical protein